MPKETSVRSQTRGEAVYDALRSDILAGRRLPGDRLRFPELVKAYDVSVTVLREALTRLDAEGLVTSAPHLGYAVTALSIERLEELTDARLALECLVLERAVQQGDLDWESRAVAAHHVLKSTPYLAEGTVRVSDEWAVAHAKFHNALLDGCANRRLHDLAISLRSEAELYRRWSEPLGSEHDRDVAGEHEAILNAALERDAARATQLLAAHITLTTRLLQGSQANSIR